jgi:hypothetical protein
MTGTNCDLFTHSQSRSYLNHLVHQKTYRRNQSKSSYRYKVVQIRPGQTVTCLHTNSPGHI